MKYLLKNTCQPPNPGISDGAIGTELKLSLKQGLSIHIND